MDNRESVWYRRYVFAVLMLALVLTVLRSVAFAFFFDADPGYIKEGALSVTLNIASVIAVALTLAYPIALRLKKASLSALPKPELTTPSERIVSLVAAFSFFPAVAGESGVLIRVLRGEDASGIAQISSYVRQVFRNSSSIVGQADRVALRCIAAFAALRLVLALFSALYFFRRRSSKPSPLAGIPAVLYFTFILISDYFNWNVPMNSPVKEGYLFAALAVSAYLLVEFRLCNAEPQPCRFAMFGGLATIFGISGGISQLVAGGEGVLTTVTVLRAFPVLIIGIYAAVRMITLVEFPAIGGLDIEEPTDPIEEGAPVSDGDSAPSEEKEDAPHAEQLP